MGSALFGEPRLTRGIPSFSDACWSVETVRAGSAMDVRVRHHERMAAEQETVRAAPMEKVQRHGEIACPASLRAGE
jgi:hypothetical protein